LRDVREWVADKLKARRKHVANPFDDKKGQVTHVTSGDLTCIDMTGCVESVLDPSRHAEIDLVRFRPGFRHEKF